MSGSVNAGDEKLKLELNIGAGSSSGSVVDGISGGSLVGEEVSSGGE